VVGEVSGEPAGRRGDADRDWPAAGLLPRRSAFVGRSAELEEIAARLRRHAVVTLVGVGGVGKTALAVEAAWAEVDAVPSAAYNSW
jgi:Mrp family chromosome partitioning ATPase